MQKVSKEIEDWVQLHYLLTRHDRYLEAILSKKRMLIFLKLLWKYFLGPIGINAVLPVYFLPVDFGNHIVLFFIPTLSL
jgi:hypothetical protein